jgi:hypothetical protein
MFPAFTIWNELLSRLALALTNWIQSSKGENPTQVITKLDAILHKPMLSAQQQQREDDEVQGYGGE